MVLRVTPTMFSFWEHPDSVPVGCCGKRAISQVSKSYLIHSKLDVVLDKSSGVINIRDLRAVDFVIQFTTDNPFLVEAALRGLIESTRYVFLCVSHLHSLNLPL